MRRFLKLVPDVSMRTLTLLAVVTLALLLPTMAGTTYLLVREVQRNDTQEQISCAGYASRLLELNEFLNGVQMTDAYRDRLETKFIPGVRERQKQLGC